MSHGYFSIRYAMKRAAVVAILLLLPGLTPRSGAQEAVLGEIRRLEQEFGGHLGVMAKNLETGEEVRYNAAEKFPTASVIKLPVMAAFFDLVDRGRIDTGMTVVLRAEDKKGGSGVLQYMSDGMTMKMLDAVRLMIILSDNTGTNLVLDRLAPTHAERLATVNEYLVRKGLKNTRLLNRLMSWDTKENTPEAVRHGVGVATPEDMVLLMEALHRRTLADPASCDMMLEILKQQFYGDMIPRFLPYDECQVLEVAHKTGSINEVKADVGLILSERAKIAIAVFVDKSADHVDVIDNQALLLGAHVARAIWNHFTGMQGYLTRKVRAGDVDWTRFPGGQWAIYRTGAAMFPHPARSGGWTGGDGTKYPLWPHYLDSSVVVFVPDSFKETSAGTNVIVHFHGHARDNLFELEHQQMPQAMVRQGVNAILILPQGPYRARDSFGGKMEDEGGLRRLVEDVLHTMQRERVISSARLNRVIISAHSGGYRPAGFVLKTGGLSDHVTDVFLFDAFYGQHDDFRQWLLRGTGTLHGVYTDHLADEHTAFQKEVGPVAGSRLQFEPSEVDHEGVVVRYFESWLRTLGTPWRGERE